MNTEAEKAKARAERDELVLTRNNIVDKAREQYVYPSGSTIDMDEIPVVSMSERGAYVQAWVWVDEQDVDLPEKYYNKEEDVWDWPEDCANPVTLKELEDALRELCKVFTNGDNYEVKNPYTRPEIRAANTLLARIKGMDPVEDPLCYLSNNL